ncbi:iron ABC transporter permease [Campylobacter sp. TTU-622]|uniref:iron ABC transporter permease n=1 Tax=Campylobacter sp. TTU-622 TaxID=2800583 RepID=UPI001903CC8B|nr:iron ABC transporter permease [Campylobacter sp. TTU-622]MBK1973786.1 iron ABC transporter permease [Campylobacter sp. TTU-622]
MKKLIFSLILLFLILLFLVFYFEFLNLKNNHSDLFIFILKNYVLSRIGVCFICGVLLSLASLLLRKILHNILVSDTTLGVSSASGFFLLLSSLFFPFIYENFKILIAFFGAIIILIPIFVLGYKKRFNNVSIILLGLISSLFFSALTSLFILLYPEESKAFLFYNSGYFTQNGLKDFFQIIFYSSIGFIFLYFFSSSFKILTLGDIIAKSLGANIILSKAITLILSAYLVALVVSFVGSVAFLGLFASILIHQFKFDDIKKEFLFCSLVGGFLLSNIDLILQLLQLLGNINLPTGSMVPFLGIPLLIYVIFKKIKDYSNDCYFLDENHFFISKYILFSIVFILLILFFIMNLYFDFLNLKIDFSTPKEIFDLRIYKLIILACSGILMAIAGFILQRLSFNAMASSEFLGINSGASLGVLFALWFMPFLVWPLALIGALAILFLLVFFYFVQKISMQKIILLGVCIMFLTDAFFKIVLLSADIRVYSFLAFTQAGILNASFNNALIILIFTIISFLIMPFFTRWLNALRLGEVCAINIGLDLFKVRIILLIFCALISVLVVLNTGPFSFISLLAPHLANLFFIQNMKMKLFLTTLIGALFMLLAEFLSKLLIFPYEIPLGIIATLLGSVYFIFMVRKN